MRLLNDPIGRTFVGLFVIQCIFILILFSSMCKKQCTEQSFKLQQSTVVICGLGMNISNNIASKRREIEKIGGYFEDYRVVIVSNNNTDDTLFKLNIWASENPRVHIISPEANSFVPDAATVDSQHTEEKRIAVHDQRIRRMANLRENYLDYVKIHHSSSTYMIAMDIDIKGVTCGLMSNFKRDDWSAVFVNGQTPRWFGLIHRPYDSLAFSLKGTPQTNIPSQKTRNIQLNDASLAKDFVEVESAFGGYGVYRITDIGNASYVTDDAADCEHHTFHYGIHGKKYLNPSWIGKFKSNN
jgi:hypothetical protein